MTIEKSINDTNVENTRVENTRVDNKKKQTGKEETRITQLTNELTELQIYAKKIATKDFFTTTSSHDVTKIIPALVQFKLNLPEMTNDSKVSGDHGTTRYRYQSLPGLLRAITVPLAEQGLSPQQSLQTIADKKYIVTIIWHTSGQFLRSVTKITDKYMLIGKLTITEESLQATGGAYTYTKRHALKSILGIDSDDDTDGQ